MPDTLVALSPVSRKAVQGLAMLLPSAWRNTLAFVAGLVMAVQAHGMDFQVAGPTLIMSGPVTGSDLARLKDSLAPGTVRMIVLHASSGGDLWNGLQMGELVRTAGLSTAVSGRCASACALVFLGGVERSFSDGTAIRSTRIGLHGAHDRATKAVSHKSYATVRYFVARMTGDKYPPDLMERTVSIKDARDIVYVYHPDRPGTGSGSGVVECRRDGAAAAQCHPVDGVDAMTIGVITRREVVALEPQVRVLLGPGQE